MHDHRSRGIQAIHNSLPAMSTAEPFATISSEQSATQASAGAYPTEAWREAVLNDFGREQVAPFTLRTIVSLPRKSPDQRDGVKLQPIVRLPVCHIKNMHRPRTALVRIAQPNFRDYHFPAIRTAKFDWSTGRVSSPKHRQNLHLFIQK